jgi:hypothetical protein
MRGLIASLLADVRVAATVVVLTMSAHGQAVEEIPGAELVDRRDMQVVCESSAAVNIDKTGHFQCNVCPSYTDFHGNNHQSFDLQAVYQGHFSTTNAEQVLLVLAGCEPHASGLGGAVLLTQEGTAWKNSAYFKGDKPSKCLSFKARDGLDLLVCLAGDMHFGTFTTGINVASYKDNSSSAETLLGVSGNTAGGSPSGGYCYEQDFGTFEKLASGKGFRVVVTQSRRLATPGENFCDETLEPAQTVKLNFQFDGEHFAVAPESKEGLQKVTNFVPHSAK